MNCVNGLFFLSVVGLNIFGLMVTSRLGSVFRAVLLTSRTALVSPLAPPPARASRLQYLIVILIVIITIININHDISIMNLRG